MLGVSYTQPGKRLCSARTPSHFTRAASPSFSTLPARQDSHRSPYELHSALSFCWQDKPRVCSSRGCFVPTDPLRLHSPKVRDAECMHMSTHFQCVKPSWCHPERRRPSVVGTQRSRCSGLWLSTSPWCGVLESELSSSSSSTSSSSCCVCKHRAGDGFQFVPWKAAQPPPCPQGDETVPDGATAWWCLSSRWLFSGNFQGPIHMHTEAPAPGGAVNQRVPPAPLAVGLRGSQQPPPASAVGVLARGAPGAAAHAAGNGVGSQQS